MRHFNFAGDATSELGLDSAVHQALSPAYYSRALVRFRVGENSWPRIPDHMLSLSGRARIDVAEMRPEPFGQLAQPRRLVAELDHVQDERVDPGGLVHDQYRTRPELQTLGSLT